MRLPHPALGCRAAQSRSPRPQATSICEYSSSRSLPTSPVGPRHPQIRASPTRQPGSHLPRPVPVQQGAASCAISAATVGSLHIVRGSPAQKPRTRPRCSRSSHTWRTENGWSCSECPLCGPARGFLAARPHLPAWAAHCPPPLWASPSLPSPSMANPPLQRGVGLCGSGHGTLGRPRIPETPVAQGRGAPRAVKLMLCTCSKTSIFHDTPVSADTLQHLLNTPHCTPGPHFHPSLSCTRANIPYSLLHPQS